MQEFPFLNSTLGIYVDTTRTVDVLNNNFDLNALENSKSTGNFNTVTIEDNGFSNSEVGINIHDFAWGGLHIEQNYFDLDQLSATAIRLAEGAGDAKIKGNTIKNINTGIYISNYKTQAHTIIADNEITGLNTTLSTSPIWPYSTIPNFGIILMNISYIYQNTPDHHLLVKNNLVEAKNTTTNRKVFGISIQNSAIGETSCNKVSGVGTGIHFAEVDQTSTDLFSNTMEDVNYSLVLADNAELGDIGISSAASDNKWTGSATYHTFMDQAFGNQSTLYTQGGGLPYQPTSNGSSSPGTPILNINSSATPSGWVCNTPWLAPMTSGGGTSSLNPIQIANAEYIARGSKIFAARGDTALWLAQYRLYRSLRNDSVTLASNTFLKEFKDSVDNTALGQLLTIREQMQNPSLSSSTLLSQLQSLKPEKNQEANLKDVLEIKLSKILASRDTLLPSEYSALSALAAACPFIAGPAVYTARNLLFDHKGERYWNECEGYSVAGIGVQKRIKVEENTISVKVYPNPTKGFITVELPLGGNETGVIKVFDIQGKEIIEQRLYNQVQEINFFLEPGFYYYNVKKQGKVLKSDKLIVTGQ